LIRFEAGKALRDKGPGAVGLDIFMTFIYLAK
jgi:hypothetical protein